jgi:hypothetical protein
MKKRAIIFILVIATLLAAVAVSAQAFLRGGAAAIYGSPGSQLFVKRIIDISRRNGIVDFADGTRAQLTNIWMINYESTGWDYPQERQILAGDTDTIILKNGGVIYDLVVDFSIRRGVYEFKNTKAIHWSQVKRIYIAQQIKF